MKQVIYCPNFMTRRRPGRPLKWPLDGYNREPETGHLLSYLHNQKNMIQFIVKLSLRLVKYQSMKISYV
jgi:hypothetical protein